MAKLSNFMLKMLYFVQVAFFDCGKEATRAGAKNATVAKTPHGEGHLAEK